MKVIINTEKYNVVYNWLCNNVGEAYGCNSWLQIGEGWTIRRVTNRKDVWEVAVDFRRIPGVVKTEFLLKWA